MAGRKRDYKAEYARRKQLAAEQGFKSERELKAERKRAAEWSKEHSHRAVSRYSSRMTAAEVAAYNRAFTDNHGARRNAKGRQSLINWLHKFDANVYPVESDVDFWDRYI